MPTLSTRLPAKRWLLTRGQRPVTLSVPLHRRIPVFVNGDAKAWRTGRKNFAIWVRALRSRAEEMAQTISREMGKPIVQARAEVAKSASLCDWYAEHGPSMLNPESTQVENAVIEYRPLGPILAVMPWNFPLWQVLRGAVPILLAGNSYLLKHAPNVLGSAELIGKVFADAGFPEGVFGWVNATNDGVSQAINDRRIAAVTVTGSVRAGAAIGAQAGAALKK